MKDTEMLLDKYIETLTQDDIELILKKRFIILTREDLVKFKSDLLINKISVYDFKSSSMSKNEMRKAKLIIFKDGNKTKKLKNKDGYEV